MAAVSAETPRPRTHKSARLLARNSASNVARLAVTSLVSIFLPVYLTHHLSIQTYGAWVLILQLSAYVAYLDFGVQTAVSKYIAEYEAKQDYTGCGRRASVGLIIMLVGSALGVLLTIIIAWRIPAILRTMPPSLYRDVRLSVLFVGISVSVSLATSVFTAIFLGLQRYEVPMVITITTRLMSAVTICAAVALHGSLAAIGAAVACVNLSTALLPIMAWRKLANHIRISLRSIDVTLLKQTLKYCAVLVVWNVCTLLISGLDLAIVGHYSFNETAYYAIANSPTSFIVMIIAALMGPLLPAASALSVQLTSAQMGGVLLRATRCTTILLCLTGIPLLVGGYCILRVWVGPVYALHSVPFLRILLTANICRQLCAPYSTMIIATSGQRFATASPVIEGIVNLVSSIRLAPHLGALGVALGTLLGAIIGVAMHFGVSMRYTQANLEISRTELFFQGMLRPAAIAIPSVLLLSRWWPARIPSISPQLYCAWIISTLLLAWFVSMSPGDRGLVARLVSNNMRAFRKREALI